MSGILKWVEPHDGGGYVINKDTGLCNRIYHWELAYEIARLHDFKFKIHLQKIWWPELELLDFPNTDCVDENQDKFIHKAYPFDTNILKHYNFKLDINKNWFPIDGWSFSRSFWRLYSNKWNEKRPLQRIKIKDKKLEKKIINKAKGLIGIHIRKGFGVKTVSDLGGMYQNIPEKLYINFIEKILKINPKQKFYLSTDLKLDEVNFLIKDYDVLTYRDVVDLGKEVRYIRDKNNPDTVYDNLEKKVILPIQKEYSRYLEWRKKYPDLTDKVNSSRENQINKNTIKDVVDLFSLAYCKLILEHPTSTWSSFAVEYRNLNSYEPHDKKINKLTRIDLKRSMRTLKER